MELHDSPTMQIFILQDNQQTGPFDETAVHQMVATGTVPRTALAWHEGLADWVPLNEILAFPPELPQSQDDDVLSLPSFSQSRPLLPPAFPENESPAEPVRTIAAKKTLTQRIDRHWWSLRAASLGVRLGFVVLCSAAGALLSVGVYGVSVMLSRAIGSKSETPGVALSFTPETFRQNFNREVSDRLKIQQIAILHHGPGKYDSFVHIINNKRLLRGDIDPITGIIFGVTVLDLSADDQRVPETTAYAFFVCRAFEPKLNHDEISESLKSVVRKSSASGGEICFEHIGKTTISAQYKSNDETLMIIGIFPNQTF